MDCPRVSSEIVDCGFPVTFDTYSKCSGACAYCFSSGFKDTNPSTRDGTQKLTYIKPKGIENLLSAKNEIFNRFIKDRYPIQWGGLSDPFMHEEKRIRRSLDILKVFADYGYTVRICTKGLELLKPEYKHILSQNIDIFGFMISFSTTNENTYKYLEKNTPSPKERLNVIKELNDMGSYVVLRFRPFVFGISDKNKDYIKTIQDAAKYGAKAISLEFLCYDMRSRNFKEKFDVIGKKIGFDFNKFHTGNRGSPSNYIRLTKNVEAPIVHDIYLECKKLDLNICISDPNFKELSDFGNCCASDGNYFPYQLTELLVNARKEIWNNNKKLVEFSFSDIAEPLQYYFGHIKSGKYFARHFSRREDYQWRHETIPDFILDKWNMPKLSSSIYKYLQGKIIPIGLNNQDDVVYQYRPSKWELDLRDEVKDL